MVASGLSLAASGCALSSQYREAIEQRQELVDRDEAQSARISASPAAYSCKLRPREARPGSP
ncbi:MAG: hypothetical protein CL936_03665 [Deltaproteobacteria bacterium]|nr:hypothetical protein [Deltaproteobacteria bacterium]